MNLYRRWSAVTCVLLVAAILGCSRPSETQEHASEASARPADLATTATKGAFDAAAIFPAGRGREMVLQNCQSCHTIVPIVVLQMDKDQWKRSSVDHRERVASLTQEEFTFLYDYLSANFNPERPVPELPKKLLESWTGY